MKIMFLESKPAMIGSLPKGFQDAGFEVMVVEKFYSEEHLKSLMMQFQPQLVFTQGWGDEQVHANQMWIRNVTSALNIPHVYWSIEDPMYTDYFVVPLIQVAKPDFIFTLSPEHVQYYRSLGYLCAHLDWGVHPDVHTPAPVDPRYAVELALVANSYSDTLSQFNMYRIESMLTLLKPLVENGIRVDIWGTGWELMQPYLGVSIPADWLRGELPYSECHKVYCSAKLVIGFQNVLTQVTQRTYEVLACGGILLTVDTPAVRSRFTPGEHLLASSSAEQTVKWVSEYLLDEDKRKAMGGAGRRAVLQHNYIARVGYIMDTLPQAGVFSKLKAWNPIKQSRRLCVDVMRNHMI